MQWWAEWWDSVARWFGYEQWMWGSAGEWVAAIGTVGALFLGLAILRRDKRLARRRAADQFATSQELDLDIEEPPFTHSFFFHNGADHPVLDVSLVVVDTVARSYKFLYVAPFAPHEERKLKLDITDLVADAPNLWVKFVDYLGATWYRDLESGGYVSERFMKRIQKRNPYFLHIDFVAEHATGDYEGQDARTPSWTHRLMVPLLKLREPRVKRTRGSHDEV